MNNTGYTPEEPIAAIATALVPSAIGIVRASGRNAVELASKFFSRPKALCTAQGNTLVYGWIRKSDGTLIDEVMAAVYREPKSFTGEEMIEIFCHGGVAVVQAVYSLFLANGFRPAERGEFTFRAFINGKTDLTKAEAVKEIIDSKTDGSRGRAAGRLSGNLFEEIDSVKKGIIDVLGNIEVEIEYPEDEENIAEAFDVSPLEKVRDTLRQLCSSWKSEKLYQDGAKVVLCGKTNAGKSSLFNTLLKEERAIVSSIEGTTRDWIESYVDFEGIPVRLFDTAGLRETEDLIEARGVQLTRDLTLDADVILYLVDSTRGITDEDRSFMSAQKEVPVILVLNKCEGEAEDSLDADAAGEWKNVVRISAKHGKGIDSLVHCSRELIMGSSGESDHAGLGSERQKVSVQEALERVEHALEIARSGDYGLDAVVQDLEDSLDSLGEVTGDVTPDDVLGNIFSRFCVGK
ncbi:MAG: tRNA uridine-5-carboxymethylaminomethyl(34) synthesis GTPase MnmE [Treponema sp.]|nr:tRNA uridine-5-carboxymethylaminomethyl(34) synthesis GTPase MnmE [Treponema sp.]